MKFVLTLLVLLVSSAASAVGGESGYGNTSWGMTLEEVMSSENKNLEKLRQPKVFRDSSALIVNRDITISNQSFEVLYLFGANTKGLVQVNVEAKEDRNHGINLSTFSELKRLLTSKYGAPYYENKNSKAAWVAGGSEVSLNHIFIKDILNKVAVTYKPRSDISARAKDL